MSSMEPAKTDGFKRMKLGEKERKKKKKKGKYSRRRYVGGEAHVHIMPSC